MQATSNVWGDESSELSACLKRISQDRKLPLSTYRLQLNNRFHFKDARNLIPYLCKLGVSHLYTSPILMARAGSQHGYDIIDHSKLNPEIGTEDDFRELVAELKRHGMGLLLDIVPNHMGVGHGSNPWWQDVLQNGRTSIYADFFDIDWEPLKPELRNKVLLPILGEPYGDELERGNIQLVCEDGRFLIQYFDKVFPVDPQTIPLILTSPREHRGADQETSSALTELALLRDRLGRLPANDAEAPDAVRGRQDAIPKLLTQLQRLACDSIEVRSYIDDRVATLNGTPGDSRSFDGLHALLEKQAYRLAFWRVSGEEINYRRFFDINDLVGLRMENPRVFAETHKLIRTFIAEDLISGLRLDHPDGLLTPAEYIMRLQRLSAAAKCVGADPIPPLAADGIELNIHSIFAQETPNSEPASLYLLVEKVLEAGEHLPENWPVDGSVGYDFTETVNNLFIDSRNKGVFTKLYERVTGNSSKAERLIYESKRLVMRRALASEVNVLAHRLNEISNLDRHARDFTLAVLREVIRETIACFPVYRTYIDERAHVSENDRLYIEQAIECAKQQNGSFLAAAVFDFLKSILLLEQSEGDDSIHGYRRKLYFTLKFQQLTGPVMAKGLEDTACYVYTRFISCNEVGGSPADFGISSADFHERNGHRAAMWPNSMLSTSTHDTKRSEDVRARLNVLSEIPKAWATQVMKWRRINRKRKQKLPDGRIVPDNNEEYLLYQTLVGTWPVSLSREEGLSGYAARIKQYMEKSAHEAKVNVSWLNPNPSYVEAMNKFVDAILSPGLGGRTNLFWDSMQRFVQPVTYFGLMNSLAQTVLKLTSPGVPDIYQGQEMWDFSLVDPDNRRPVDFEGRQRSASQMAAAQASGELPEFCEDLLASCRDGRMKLWVTARALNFRRDHKMLFQKGGYTALQATRGREEHVVAFARCLGEQAAITAVPRFTQTLMKGKEQAPLGLVWGDSELVLPPELAGSRLYNVFTGERFEVGTSILCREVFNKFPVALLVSI